MCEEAEGDTEPRTVMERVLKILSAACRAYNANTCEGYSQKAASARLDELFEAVSEADGSEAGWIVAAFEAYDDVDTMGEIRRVLDDDTGRIEAVRLSDGFHVEDRYRDSNDAELVEDIRRVKERADRLLAEACECKEG